ncbi:hypothetical protein CEXT_679451 [Caerostris extrusa]|uniref:Uncharacterized protein n=1 Tax=Caerostris extrusa TaxID=172846 RepID=A0AAV4YB07_CAEEX|nr:hypothetical protein CEXT_679451 [Caerostris extrusa]
MSAVFAHSSNGWHFNHLRCNLSHLVARTPCHSFNIHKESGIPLGTWNKRPPSPKRDPLDAQAPSISLINLHLQPAKGLSSRSAPVCISVALRNKINVIGRGEVNQF